MGKNVARSVLALVLVWNLAVATAKAIVAMTLMI
jgi:hypothetical protein